MAADKAGSQAEGIAVDEQVLPTSADQVAYLADMVQELRDMADRCELTTLAAILEVARIEAEIQRVNAAAGQSLQIA